MSNEESANFELVVRDRPGVLVRVAQVFARRGYNIRSLKVSPLVDGVESRMNIEVDGIERVSLIVAQLNKLVDVKSAKVLFRHDIDI